MLTNIHGLPDALVAAVRNDPYVGGGDISVTKLIDAPQRRVLIKKNQEHIVEDVSERVYSLMGQAVHAVLERAGTNAIVEKRLYADVLGWKLSGQFDRVNLWDGVLQDYKVCSVYKAEGDIGWERQLNVLRWLLHKNDLKVDRLQTVGIFRDWKKSEAKRNPNYPQINVMTIDVPMWTLHETQIYIEERVAMHQAATNGETVECTDNERWYAGTKYALMKVGGKRATKTADTIEELGEVGKGYEVITRLGAYRRCEDYCEVANFCPQFKRSKESFDDDAF